MFTSRFGQIGIVLTTLITIVLGWLLIKLWYGDQNRTTSFQSIELEEDTFSQQSPRLTEADVLPSKRTATERASRYGKTPMSTVKESENKNTEDINGAEDEAIWDEIIKEIMAQAEDKLAEQTGNNEVHEEEVKKTSQLTPQKTIAIFDGIPVEVELGKKYRVTQYGVGTWNPRPKTPEEEKRFAELLQELLFENPSKERKREIRAELNAINAETAYPSKSVSVFWLPLPGQTKEDEPPDSEIIDIDLTRDF